MSDKKVAILLSTYNGEKFLPDLLSSISEQSYKNIELYIRDDGSKDSTVDLIKSADFPFPVHILSGENIGFCKSFITLLKESDADYYSFADQDDIWYKQKVETAVNWLNSQNSATPLAYHCGYDLVDENDNITGQFLFSNKGFDFRSSLTENHYSGFCLVINEALKQLVLKGNPEEYGFHDWWAAIISKALGVGYFDTYIGASHRCHKKNVTKQTFFRRVKWFMQSLKSSDAKRRNTEFKKHFYECLSDRDKKTLDLFTDEKYNFLHSIKKAFYPKHWRPDFMSEIAIRFLMLIGKI